MGDSRLWLANTNGNVFTISTDQQHLRQLTKTYRGGVKLKSIAAHHNGAWGIGHDHSVYVFVHSSEVPIRVQETTYENQRWAPLRGFHHSHLLPTDRGWWSDEVGDGSQPREGFQLPSEHWEWEGDWMIDINFQGEVISDPEGWVYATNFPGPWLLESKWKSCVRRRKWIRFRRFTRTDVWAMVSDETVKDNGESFNQIAVGGFHLPKQPAGFLSVWAISSTGDIYVRTGVTRDCPEGVDWIHQNTDTLGAVNIAVGPTGLVWTVTWDGLALVRLGVNSEHVYGTHWMTVSYPDEHTRLMQLALGLNSLWVLTREGKVWFRKGISGTDLSSGNVSSATGSDWIEMVGEMSHITITPNDHVFAIGMDDQEIYFRAGITSSDVGGRSWQKLCLQEEMHRTATGSDSSITSEKRNDSDMEESSCYSDSVSLTSEARTTPMHDVFSLFNSGTNEIDGSEQHSGENPKLPASAACSEKYTVPPFSSVNASGDINFESSHGDTHCTQKSTANIYSSGDNVDSVEIKADGQIPNSLKHSADVLQYGDSVNIHPSETMDVNVLYPVEHYFSSDDVMLNIKNTSLDSSFDDTDSKMCSPKSSEIINFVTDLLNSEPGETVDDVPQSRDPCSDNIHKVAVYSNQCSSETYGLRNSDIISRNKRTTSPRVSCNSGLPNDIITGSLIIPNSDSIPGDKMAASPTIQRADFIPGDKITTSTSVSWVSLLPSEAYTGTITDDFETSVRNSHSGSKSVQCSEGANGGGGRGETLPTDDTVIEMFVLTPAMPRYCWMQLSGLGCIIQNPSQVYWLQPRKESESGKGFKSKISLRVRHTILKLLQERNSRESENVQHYNSAIDKTSWVKKASMQWFHFGRHAAWLPCVVEVELGLDDHDTGLLTVHYTHSGKQMHVQLLLRDVVCVYRVSTANRSTVFAIHTTATVTPVTPHLLSPASEGDASDWVSVICGANASLWNMRSPIPSGSLWSTTLRGDVYVHRPLTSQVKTNEMCWIPVGGHLEYIETCPCGVTWALGYNHTVWYYSGGFGGGVFKEQSGISRDVHLQSDVRTMAVYENQKWYPIVGYSACGLLRENFNINNGVRRREHNKEDVKLPSTLWQWQGIFYVYILANPVWWTDWNEKLNCTMSVHSTIEDGDWYLDYNAQGGVDNDGWQYAVNFKQNCKLETLGPWLQVGQTKLNDVSLQIDAPSSPTDPLVVWAVGTRGNLLCRIGVTQQNPQGESWVHIPSDVLFHTVSVGGAYRVWAVARDGSAWHRTKVSPTNPQGSNWVQVVFPPEDGTALSRISAGKMAVWVVNRNGVLWYRKDITDTYPEGTSWVRVCDKVLDVSVGPSDQVWIVANSNFCRSKHSRGVVYRRVGISQNYPAGSAWEIVIGSGWKHVSVRGQIEQDKTKLLA